MPGTGPAAPLAILVGDFPAEMDYREGELYTSLGPTGKILDAQLEAARLGRRRIFLAPAVACVPKEPQRKKELVKAVACCRPLLLSQLAKFQPTTPVLVMGAWALRALDGKQKPVGPLRGFVDLEWSLSHAQHRDSGDGDEGSDEVGGEAADG